MVCLKCTVKQSYQSLHSEIKTPSDSKSIEFNTESITDKFIIFINYQGMIECNRQPAQQSPTHHLRKQAEGFVI